MQKAGRAHTHARARVPVSLYLGAILRNAAAAAETADAVDAAAVAVVLDHGDAARLRVAGVVVAVVAAELRVAVAGHLVDLRDVVVAVAPRPPYLRHADVPELEDVQEDHQETGCCRDSEQWKRLNVGCKMFWFSVIFFGKKFN